MRKPLQLGLVLAPATLGFLVAMPVWASTVSYGISTDHLNYDGTVTVYNTLTDAQNKSNGQGSYDIPSYTDSNSGITYNGRDLGIYTSNGAPTSEFSQNYNEILTAWYYTTTANGYGWGNPNNTDTGFFQIADDNLSSITHSDASWNPSLTTFHLTIDGANSTYADDYARLWDAPNVGGAASLTRGTFLNYSLDLTLTFANPATADPSNPGWFSTLQEPVAASGTLTGLFDNTCNTDVTCPNSGVDGYYAFNYQIGLGSWAYDNKGLLTNTIYPFQPTYVGTNNVATHVPEPNTVSLFLVGLLGLGFMGWRRRKITAA